MEKSTKILKMDNADPFELNKTNFYNSETVHTLKPDELEFSIIKNTHPLEINHKETFQLCATSKSNYDSVEIQFQKDLARLEVEPDDLIKTNFHNSESVHTLKPDELDFTIIKKTDPFEMNDNETVQLCGSSKSNYDSVEKEFENNLAILKDIPDELQNELIDFFESEKKLSSLPLPFQIYMEESQPFEPALLDEQPRETENVTSTVLLKDSLPKSCESPGIFSIVAMVEESQPLETALPDEQCISEQRETDNISSTVLLKDSLPKSCESPGRFSNLSMVEESQPLETALPDEQCISEQRETDNISSPVLLKDSLPKSCESPGMFSNLSPFSGMLLGLAHFRFL